MTCYFRQLKEVFAEAGIQVTPANRKQIDRAIQHIVGTDGKHCPETWAKVKERIRRDEKRRREFIIKLSNTMK